MKQLTLSKSRWYPAAGILVPSVTTVLQLRFPGPVAEDEETAALWAALRERGTNIHALIAKGSVDAETWEQLPHDVQNGLFAWQRFLNKFRYRSLGSEVAMVSARMGYGGTLDSYGRIHEGIVIIDWKSGRLWPDYAELQLGGYFGLYTETFWRRKEPYGAIAVRLDCKTGNYEAMSRSRVEMIRAHQEFMGEVHRFEEERGNEPDYRTIGI